MTPSLYLHEVKDTPTSERWNYQNLALRGLAVMAESIRLQRREHSVAPSGPDTDCHIPSATFHKRTYQDFAIAIFSWCNASI